MSRRVGTFSEVKLFSRSVDQRLQYPGFSAKSTVREMQERGYKWCSTFRPSDYTPRFSGYGDEYIPSVGFLMLGSKWAAACARPFANMTLARNLNASYYSTSGGQWSAITGNEYGECIMFQEDSTPQQCLLRTYWQYGTNPVFMVSYWRGEANRQFQDAAQRDNWNFTTQIGFGGAHGEGISDTPQFRLDIPYNGAGPQMQVYNHELSQWEEMGIVEGSSKLPAVQGMPAGQRQWLWFLVARGAIWVSPDGFRSQSCGWEIPKLFRAAPGVSVGHPNEDLVKAGPVWICHTAGQFAATVYCCVMPNVVTGGVPWVCSEPSQALYTVADNPETIQMQGWADADVSDDGSAVSDVNLSQVSVGSSARSIKASMEPTYIAALTIDAPDSLTSAPITNTSPMLFGMQILQAPHLSATGSSGASTIYTTRSDIDIQARGIGQPATARITLHNPGNVATNVRDYMRCQITLGERFTDPVSSHYDDGMGGTGVAWVDTASNTSAVVWTGWVVTPGHHSRPGAPDTLELHGFDAMTKLKDVRAMGDEPDCAMMTPAAALKFFLGRALVPSSAISGVGPPSGVAPITLVSGEAWQAESDKWKPRMGAPYADFVKQLLRAGVDDAAVAEGGGTLRLRYTAAPTFETWVRTSGPFTGTSANYVLRERVPSDYGSSVYHIFDVSADRHGAWSDDYANVISVIGEETRTAARPVNALWFDPGSVDPANARFAGGWWHTHVERDAALTTDAKAWKRAKMLASQIGTPVREYVTVTTDLVGAVEYGQVFQLSGVAGGKIAALSANGSKYRVEQYSHKAAVGQAVRTTLTGRRLPD